MSLLAKGFEEFDRINRQDPRMQTFQGKTHPREWIFSQQVSFWINRLQPKASEAICLAARSHTVTRWEVPRNRFPMNTVGYHAWRAETARHSADTASESLRRIGYPKEIIERVYQLITRQLDPKDPEAQLLEDADCLAFLEIKLGDYLSQWDEAKLERILSGTWRKMSPGARRMALEISMPADVKKIIERF